MNKKKQNVENNAQLFFIEKSMSSFFDRMNLQLTIMRMNRVVFAYFIRLFKTFSSSHMTTIILNLLAVTTKSRLIIIFVISLNIYATFLNIVRNVKRIKHVVTCRTIRFDSFSRRRYFFTQSR